MKSRDESLSTNRAMRRQLSRREVLRLGGLFAVGIVGLPAVAAACSTAKPTTSAAPMATSGATTTTAAAPTVGVPSLSGAPVKTDMYLAIVTGGMIKKKDWPAFLPSSFSVPANATVTFHVLNFDDPDDMSAADLVQYTKATGTVSNTVTVQPISDDAPNTLGNAQTASQLDPKAGVSHTFTVSQLGINAPLAPHAWTTFTIQTSAAGSFDWECKVPCGTDPNGNGGPMVTDGYMQGKMTVA